MANTRIYEGFTEQDGKRLLITTMLIGQEAEITPKFESCSLDCHVSYTLYKRYHCRPRANIIVSRTAVRDSRSACINRGEAIVTPACRSLMMGAVTRPPWPVKACSYTKTPSFVFFRKGRPTLRAVGLLKTRSSSSQVHAKTDRCTMHPAVRADEPSSNAVLTGTILA